MSDDIAEWLRAGLWGPTFERYPGYAWVLARLEPVADPKVEVMAVSQRGGHLRLHVNRPYFDAHPEFLPGVLLHEIHHVVLGHLSDTRLREVVYPDLMTIAMEVSANEYIREPLPGTPCRWEDYSTFGLAGGQSTRERYQRLAEARRTGSLPAMSLRLVDRHDFAAGEDAESPGAPALVQEILTKLGSGEPGDLADDGGWVAGHTPGSLLANLREADAPPAAPIDWRAALSLFIGRLRTPAWSYTRPSRRFRDRIGQVPGRLRRPGSDGRLSLLVAIDTSASMEEDTLVEVAVELRHLVEQMEVRATVVECDADI